MKKIIFAIDVDEVLRKLLGNMVDLYNSNFGENISKDDVKDFRVEVSFPKIESVTGTTASKWFFQEHGEELFAKSDAFPNIRRNIQTLQKYGNVIIVTYQKSYNNKIDTLNWLQKHGIEPDGICFLKDKTMLQCDFLIDDNDWNFIGSNAKMGILINAPYNKDVDIDKLLKSSNCENIVRYPSLDAFVKNFVSKQTVKNVL